METDGVQNGLLLITMNIFSLLIVGPQCFVSYSKVWMCNQHIFMYGPFMGGNRWHGNLVTDKIVLSVSHI